MPSNPIFKMSRTNPPPFYFIGSWQMWVVISSCPVWTTCTCMSEPDKCLKARRLCNLKLEQHEYSWMFLSAQSTQSRTLTVLHSFCTQQPQEAPLSTVMTSAIGLLYVLGTWGSHSDSLHFEECAVQCHPQFVPLPFSLSTWSLAPSSLKAQSLWLPTSPTIDWTAKLAMLGFG